MNSIETAAPAKLLAEAVEAHRKGDAVKAFELATLAWNQVEFATGDAAEKALVGGWYGYFLATTGGKMAEGLDLCRAAAKKISWKPAVFENLALLEAKAGWRKRAVDALQTGLKLFPDDPHLNQVKEEIGWREDPAVPFLARSNPLNKTVGRIRHARKKASTDSDSE